MTDWEGGVGHQHGQCRAARSTPAKVSGREICGHLPHSRLTCLGLICSREDVERKGVSVLQPTTAN